MKKKVLLMIMTVLILAIALSVMAGCTENLNADAIPTDFTDKIESNGGMAVVYGDYLYFVNGNAGNSDVDNIFGTPEKGAISRIALKDGVPTGKAQIVVPKIVYGTDNGQDYRGMYIVDDYIYYSTPNSARDGNGDQKLSEMVIMRTKVDGTGSQQIAEFEDFSTVFAVGNNNLVYIRDEELHSINLASKDFEDTKVEEDNVLTNYKIVDGYFIYCMYNDEDNTDYILKAYSWSGGDPILLVNSEKLRKEGTDTKYKISLIDADFDDNNFTAYFTLKDDELNAPEEGICSITFDMANPVFDRANMIRYTNSPNTTDNLNYTQFAMFNEYVLAMSDQAAFIYNKDGSYVKTNVDGTNEQVPVKIDLQTTSTLRDVVIEEDKVVIRYDQKSAIYALQIFNISEDGTYTYVEKNVEKIFAGSVDSSYFNSEIIGNVVYYMNSDVSNNAYYYVIPDEITTDTDYNDVELLGEVTREDFIASITASE